MKFIPVVCYNFLILITVQYFIVWIYNNSCPHYILDEHLGNFQFVLLETMLLQSCTHVHADLRTHFYWVYIYGVDC